MGLDKFAHVVAASAEGVGATALSTLKDSLSDLSSAVDSNIDLTPTITPVLDLTSVKKTSKELWSMMDTKPVKVDGSYSMARQAEVGYQNNRDVALVPADGLVGDTLIFNQTNTSPKALSTAEIYRNTNNQLSKAKGVLTT